MKAAGRINLTDNIASIGSFFSGRACMCVGSYYCYYSCVVIFAIILSFLYFSFYAEKPLTKCFIPVYLGGTIKEPF